jgi:S-adenosylhomocysteine hydrolase
MRIHPINRLIEKTNIRLSSYTAIAQLSQQAQPSPFPVAGHVPHIGGFKPVLVRSQPQPQQKPLNLKEVLLSLARSFNQTNNSKPLENVLLVGIQHMLGTTVDMFAAMKELGLKDAIVGGKSYSNHIPSIKRFEDLGFEFVENSEQIGYGRFNDIIKETAYTIWKRALNKIYEKKYDLVITLDDGADLLLTTHPKLFNGIKNKPDAVVGIEQTRGGSNHPYFLGLPFPIINVAGSYIKNVVEYPWVAEAVAEKTLTLVNQEVLPLIKKQPIVGIIGYGTMGKTVAARFQAAGFKVIVYDIDAKFTQAKDVLSPIFYPEPGLLVNNADIIIGCTGEDITATGNTLAAILYSTNPKWLISTGSKDVEFNSLLWVVQNNTKKAGYTPDPLSTINFSNKMGANISILRGGFPINFDNSEHSVSPERIWPTRASLLLGCLTATNLHYLGNGYLKDSTSILKLDPQGQLEILREYQEISSFDPSLEDFKKLPKKEQLAYITEHSEGEIVDWNSNSNKLKCRI